MTELDNTGLFAPLARSSGALKAVVRTDALEAALAGLTPTIVEPLTALASHDDMRLAEEAAALLDAMEPATRGGFAPSRPAEAIITTTE